MNAPLPEEKVAALAKYREPLAEWFRDFHTNGGDYPIDVWREDAVELLASPVLAQIVADAKAAERERVAQAIEAEMNHDAVRNATLATAARIARTPAETDRPEGASA